MANQQKVIITGASGMVGSLVLQHCLEDQGISKVVSFVRRRGAVQHPKLTEIVIQDFLHWEEQAPHFQNVSALFC